MIHIHARTAAQTQTHSHAALHARPAPQACADQQESTRREKTCGIRPNHVQRRLFTELKNEQLNSILFKSNSILFKSMRSQRARRAKAAVEELRKAGEDGVAGQRRGGHLSRHPLVLAHFGVSSFPLLRLAGGRGQENRSEWHGAGQPSRSCFPSSPVKSRVQR